MTSADLELPSVLQHSPTRVVFGSGALTQLGTLARQEGAARVLVVTDPGIVAAGHVDRAVQSLTEAGLAVAVFDGVHENPTTEHVARAVALAASHDTDFFVGLGGGSSMDCAKGANLILCNGGEVADYWGINKAREPMRPMIAVPTTSGTGSEAQSFALITDPKTHQKMACGDRRPPLAGGLRPRYAVLDPEVTLSQPPTVAAAAGIDAIAHAVETSATKTRTDVSRELSREAWRCLESAFERSIENPHDEAARSKMLLGAHVAGIAIEHSMLGAAHACANPLTGLYGLVHGYAVGMMLPHVVRFNCDRLSHAYADISEDAETLIARLNTFLEVAGLPTCLAQSHIPRERLPELAAVAANQWTVEFNPVAVDHKDLLQIYEAAYE